MHLNHQREQSFLNCIHGLMREGEEKRLTDIISHVQLLPRSQCIKSVAVRLQGDLSMAPRT